MKESSGGFMFLILLIIMFIGMIFIYMYLLSKWDQVVRTELLFDDFPQSFGELNIFFISDIHRRLISKKMIQEVKGKVDIVIIGGDLAEKGVPIERVEENIKRLRELGLIYFVWGNNDYEINPRLLDALLLKYGVKILDNTAVSFESYEGDKILLLGVDDLTSGRARLDLALLDANEQGEGFKILVSHNPQIIEEIKESDKISFILSGHTHGGQIRLFSFGLYEVGSVKNYPQGTILVSNGYGTTAVPLRLGAKPETHLITLSNNKKN